ncbi:hypothetical protein KsCSTR_19360 [Candidatus Kuenenia stuttgartiensis]|uniref:Uncharacterized protein n=1 Tax=Kuenenia stuttgartiensis TaxID=174633 RepID=Q1Q2I8_KUEST|nr:hypothetical protein KsCSTR_19360 [Candidatus Kuenenia stuttgartiensis]CAJ74219.1 unknown protein [Candidatus Kuenenia stuttgartiensis]
MGTRDCFVATLLAMTFFYVHILTKRCTSSQAPAWELYCKSSQIGISKIRFNFC